MAKNIQMNHEYNFFDKFYLINIFAKEMHPEGRHEDSTYENI